MRLGQGENERMRGGIRSYMSRFANNALLGGGVRVRVWTREQRNIKRSSKALGCEGLETRLAQLTHFDSSLTTILGT